MVRALRIELRNPRWKRGSLPLAYTRMVPPSGLEPASHGLQPRAITQLALKALIFIYFL